jgi:hypothetical protein
MFCTCRRVVSLAEWGEHLKKTLKKTFKKTFLLKKKVWAVLQVVLEVAMAIMCDLQVQYFCFTIFLFNKYISK